jgi:DNA mismatch repair ATPase MutS
VNILKSSKTLYQNHRSKYEKLYNKLEKEIHSIGFYRLVTFLTGFIVAIFSYRIELYYLFWSSSIVFSSLFIYLVIIHHKLENFNNYVRSITKINKDSIDRLDGKWVDFQDIGQEFQDENHEFSQDLNIFGRGSLFQWVNTTNTLYGRKKLKEFLTNPLYKKEVILEKQEALIELGKKRWWRQRFQVEAMQINEKIREDIKLFNWIKNPNSLYARKEMIYIIRLLPTITIISFLLAFVYQTIPSIIPMLALLLHIGLMLLDVKKRNIVLRNIYTFQKNIKVYGRMLEHFEKANFKSKYINNIKDKIKTQNGLAAFEQLRMLQKIVDSISNRSNLFFFIINIVLLWDYQCMVSLENWKKQSAHLTEKWIQSLGEVEALSSLAIINSDYPDWAIPELTTYPSMLKAKELGHPLLTNEQTFNDIKIDKSSRILLITGSNMSGKSTLLRTTGINLILAYVGAPVCAQNFKCSIMRIFTCMNVSDNLEKGISSFYAELLRIKNILEATKENIQVFFLLDEIFKGTNSYDRHLGAKMLINKLLRQNSIGLVSTHDLELGELEEENNYIANYNFQEYYKDNQIFFDYKLRRGVSTTRNALYLMKMIGIED